MIVSRQSVASLVHQLTEFFASLVHYHVKADVTDLETISLTPVGSGVPKADSETAKIDRDWIPTTYSGGGFGDDIVATLPEGGLLSSDVLPEISRAKLVDGTALSVVGRSENSTGDLADIAASAASGAVLRESGSALAFGTVATAGLADGAVTLAKQANLAQATINGRASGAGTGVPTALTAAQVRTIVASTSVAADTIPLSQSTGLGSRLVVDWLKPTVVGGGTRGLLYSDYSGAVAWADASTSVANLVPIYKGTSTDIQFARFGSSTAFAGSPVDGQWCWREDMLCGFKWSSTASAWLSDQVYEIAFGDNASTSSGTYFRQLPIATAARYSSSYGESFGFDVLVVGITVLLGSSTCTITVEDDGSDVTNGAMSLSSQTSKQDELLHSSVIAAGSIIGVKCTSGTATNASTGRVRFRRVQT